MARYVARFDSTMDLDQAFDHLADFANAALWDPSVEQARQLGSGPTALGSRYELRVRVGKRTMPLTYEIVEFVRPQRVVLQASTPTITSRDEMTFAPRSDGINGTSIVYDAKLDLKGPWRIAGPWLSRVLRGLGQRAEAGLRREMNP